MNLDYLIRYRLVGKTGLRLQRWRGEWQATRVVGIPGQQVNQVHRIRINRLK